jgi:predicted nucleic acid-binding protein
VIVVDASVIVTALAAPHLIDVEVVSAWRRLLFAGSLDERRVGIAITDLRGLRIERVPHRQLVDRCWELRDKLTTYDATYVALAELLDVALLTADTRLTRAPGTRCQVELLA